MQRLRNFPRKLYTFGSMPNGWAISDCTMVFTDWYSVGEDAGEERTLKVHFASNGAGYYVEAQIIDGNDQVVPNKFEASADDIMIIGEFLAKFANMMTKEEDKAMTLANDK